MMNPGDQTIARHFRIRQSQQSARVTPQWYLRRPVQFAIPCDDDSVIESRNQPELTIANGCVQNDDGIRKARRDPKVLAALDTGIANLDGGGIADADSGPATFRNRDASYSAY